MDLSIIIPTNNKIQIKSKSLELTLMSIYMQDIKNSFEVIVIENGNDFRPDYFDNYSNLNYCFIESKGSISKARNYGVSLSKGDLIFFMDDDSIIYERDLISRVSSLINNENSFTCGIKRYWTYVNWNFERIYNELLNFRFDYLKNISILPTGFDRDSGYRSLHEISFLGNFGCLSRKLFESVNGFDENYKVWGREDCDIMYRLLIPEKANFINCNKLGQVYHLNHPVSNKSKYLNENEMLYQTLEKKHGIHIKWGHLFGIYEDDNHEVYINK